MAEELSNYIEDDWNDNALNNRSNPEKGIYYSYSDGGTGNLLKGVYRPRWDVADANPLTVSNNINISNTYNDDGRRGIIQTPSVLTIGSWSFDLTVSGIPSNYGNSLYITLMEDVPYTYINNSDALMFWTTPASDYVIIAKMIGGSTTILIRYDKTWSDGTFSYETTRDSYGNFELFEDSASKGTATDTFVPDETNSMSISYRDEETTGPDFAIDNLLVR